MKLGTAKNEQHQFNLSPAHEAGHKYNNGKEVWDKRKHDEDIKSLNVVTVMIHICLDAIMYKSWINLLEAW